MGNRENVTNNLYNSVVCLYSCATENLLWFDSESKARVGNFMDGLSISII